jgi:PTH1 family peptidyl-tRNA hydrolase
VKVILGLGNPGREYASTRHNVGWSVVDHLVDAWAFDSWKRDGDALVATGMVGPTRTRLIKPQTYVNLSGAVLRPYARRPFWSGATDLLVIADDVAIPVGTFRLRRSGSSGGHNGLKSIEAALGSRDYARLRIGIRPDDEQRQVAVLRDFVLGPLGKAERSTILSLMPTLADAAQTWIREGIDVAMNTFNRRPPTC